MASKKESKKTDPIIKNRERGRSLVASHPLLEGLSARTTIELVKGRDDFWMSVSSRGTLRVNDSKLASPQQWQWAFAHALVHLGLAHLDQENLQQDRFDHAWNAAGCIAVNRLLEHLKLGQSIVGPVAYPKQDETELAEIFRFEGVPESLRDIGTAGQGADLIWDGEPIESRWASSPTQRYEEAFAQGLQAAVSAAIKVAAGEQDDIYSRRPSKVWSGAISWFISSYPLLGGLLASLEVVQSAELCWSQGIAIAAVNPVLGELYLNPDARLNPDERRFVVAHEVLHVGLRHDVRRDGRDPWLWNVACDFAINGWLMEMELGQLPDQALYDPTLKGQSAEEIYDRIANDLRKYRKLATLRGIGKVDIIEERIGPRGNEAGADLDAFYRRAMATGLRYHSVSDRGLLPAGMIEEIRSLSQPPIPWDVKLAQWFDDHFKPVEAIRTYARPSRRQGATPDIPRPSYQRPPIPVNQRTFGVVLDTSGSMDRSLLGKALGAIASYSNSRDVPAARVVFCDAAAYDAGYLSPDEIAGKVRIRGRGGTVLQPGVDLLLKAKDFPKEGPILLITDGLCDRVSIPRDHAVLTPKGSRLPFTPKGPVFRIS